MNQHDRDTETKSLMILLAALLLFSLLICVELIRASMAHAELSGNACLTIKNVPPGAITKVYDGDTFTLFTVGPGGEVDIRVMDIDTPERKFKEPGWVEARAFTVAWLARGAFSVDTCGKKTLTRIEAVVSRDGETLADALRAAGHVKP